MERITLLPDSAELGLRADSWIAARLEISRSAAAILMENGNVTVDGNPVKKNEKIRELTYEVCLPDPKPLDTLPENIPLDIVYEDEHLLVVNKPRGMVVHPAAGNETGTLVNALLYHCGDSLSGINGVMRPGIVHRIDKDTSGLLIVAKSDEAHRGLAEQIKVHSFDRIYECLAFGNFKETHGTLTYPIGRHPIDRKRMAVVAGGRHATTHFEVLASYPAVPVTHLRLQLETGRTHQIRVHLSHIGHPVIGDPVYSNRASEKIFSDFKGQCLHARSIAFTHPVTGERLSFTSALPAYFQELLLRAQKKESASLS